MLQEDISVENYGLLWYFVTAKTIATTKKVRQPKPVVEGVRKSGRSKGLAARNGGDPEEDKDDSSEEEEEDTNDEEYADK
jgi:hypothetical protein